LLRQGPKVVKITRTLAYSCEFDWCSKLMRITDRRCRQYSDCMVAHKIAGSCTTL